MYAQPLFTIFGNEVYAYGVCMALGIIACFVLLYVLFARNNMNEDAIESILFIGFFATAFGILSATLFQSFYNYLADPEGGFRIGGMTFIGGLIGGVVSFLTVWNLYMYVIAPRTKIKFLKYNGNATLTDALPFIPIGIAIAHSFGRLGCFFAGCCHGMETDAWYGVYMPSVGAKVIPTQLFECIFLALLALVMLVLVVKYKFKCNFGIYSISYGVWRFLIEFIRNDDRGAFVDGLTPSQFWCIIMVLAGIAYFFAYKYLFKNLMKHPELQPSVRNKEEVTEQE